MGAAAATVPGLSITVRLPVSAEKVDNRSGQKYLQSKSSVQEHFYRLPLREYRRRFGFMTGETFNMQAEFPDFKGEVSDL
jgi:hypothetical protein